MKDLCATRSFHNYDPMLGRCSDCSDSLTLTPTQQARMNETSQAELDDLAHGALNRPADFTPDNIINWG